jgi:hypothetical protein
MCLGAVAGGVSCAAVKSSAVDAGTRTGTGGSTASSPDGSSFDSAASDLSTADSYLFPLADLLSPADKLVAADVAGGGADAACATQSAMAETLPLDLYVMMDSSASMNELTGNGTSKWDAVRAAMTAFFDDPQSAGIGVGLQYFPQVRAGVPDLCTTDAMCAGFGPCDRLRTCYGPKATMVVTCNVNSDCPKGETCELLGFCPLEAGNPLCAPSGVTLCAPLGDPCTDLGGNCRGRDLCDMAVYAAPAVTISTLPGAAPGLVASLGGHMPDGLTPTGPALTGALQYAQQRAGANPGHKVAILLVTDGFPSECMPADIPGVAAVAAQGAMGAPSIPTFVIGVFGAADAAAAPANLNALAAGGGTGTAVVIDTSQNVTQALQTALNQIRTTAVACEYMIPPPTVGTIDFGKVNVQLTGGNGAPTTIGHVTSKAACDPARGGWYYDVDPSSGKSPTSIITCDATCTGVRATAAARVDIVLGCQTIVIM